MTSPRQGFAVAIDGPSGVGKSTAAKLVAEKLGITYIDTGAMYRTIALYNICNFVDLTNESAVVATLADIDVSLSGPNVFLNGKDVTNQIRSHDISEATSLVATYPAVRKKLVLKQKQIAQSTEVVMDGRDIGSEVLPWAQVKIYLDADVDVRANRRVKDLEKKGQLANFEQIRHDVVSRDLRDKSREFGPLIKTTDAIYIDTSHMSQNDVVERILTHINEARGT